MVDIAAVCKIAHRQKDIFVVVDNTFESAYFQVMHKSNLLREMPMKFSKLMILLYMFTCDNCYSVASFRAWSGYSVLFPDKIHEWAFGCNNGRGGSE